jgi:hypothetical protein
MSAWRSGNATGAFYLLSVADLERVGDCWMKGRLHVRDLVLCVGHTGDCFHDFILIKEFVNGLRGIPASRFGAYALANPTRQGLDPDGADFHNLAAGNFVADLTAFPPPEGA